MTVDRKFFHSLIECTACGVLHRYPTERDREMAEFYQHAYAEPGFASEMPDEATLRDLLASNFKGSTKDFSGEIAILEALGLRAGQRLLDFGASWGYATYQFRQAGFAAEGFELSKPRAEFGRRLGLDISVVAPNPGEQFDLVYSSHVLEHVPNPLQTLKMMLSWTKPGGLVVAQTPNGSRDFRVARPGPFHRLWGRVHPFLLTAGFVERNFGHHPCYVSSEARATSIALWDRRSRQVADTGGSNLFFAIVKIP
jgi:SAM-dependent methyltransferase